MESGAEWHLVAQLRDFIRVYPMRMITAVRLTDQTFNRPASFDLSKFWSKWKNGMRAFRRHFIVDIEFSGQLARELSALVAEDVGARGPAEVVPHAGRTRMKVTFRSFESARRFALAHGDAVRIHGPKELAISVSDFARRTFEQYGAAAPR